MGPDIRTAAGRALQEVLERQAFVFADPDPGAGAPEGPMLAVSLRFGGDAAGGLALALPLEVAREIASGVLGCEPDDPAADLKAGDACREILNIVCGQALTSAFGPDPVFDLTIPEVRSLTPEEGADWTAAGDVLGFSVDGAPVLLRVEFTADPA